MYYVQCRKILDVNMSITLYWIMKTYDEILGTEECKKDREREMGNLSSNFYKILHQVDR